MSRLIDELLSAGSSGASGETPGEGSTAAGSPPERKAFTVEQYNRSVEKEMKKFPKVWVKGVLTQVDARGKAVYMTLADFAEGDARPRAVLPVMMWAWDFENFAARFAQLPTPFQIRPELKVSFLLESSYYVPTGRFQPKVVDVDESFTLGELARTRQKILEALRKEGLLEANKRLSLSEVPLRVGLVSAPGSAAFQDFTTVLLNSGFSFEIVFAEARMQGQATEESVVRALSVLAKCRGGALDVICVVRGGGSKTDLVYFDSEAICRAIATCPVPVLTGIGHEIDRSLADVVAYQDLLTPTDCAKFLEGRVEDAWRAVCRRAAAVRDAWEEAYESETSGALERAQALGEAWDARSRREAQRQGDFARGIAAAARRMLRAAREKLALDRIGLLRGPEKLVRHEIESLGLRGRLLQASDPAALLKRGFAQVVSAAGKWIRGAGDASAGDVIRVRFADGELDARVEYVKRKET